MNRPEQTRFPQKVRGGGQGDFDNVQIGADFFSQDCFPNLVCKMALFKSAVSKELPLSVICIPRRPLVSHLCHKMSSCQLSVPVRSSCP